MENHKPEPRKGHAAVGVGGTVYVWAGDGGPTTILTRVMERFDVSSQEWKKPQQLSRRSRLPDGLVGMATTVESENAYFFGGKTDSGSYTNTLFEVNLSILQCRELLPTDSTNAPKGKTFSAMVCFNEKLVVHGGFTGVNQTDELHLFDLSRGTWSAQPTTGEKPCPRTGHTFTKIDHHRAVVFGGWTGTSELNDAYILDLETWHWTKVKDSRRKPHARNHHAACCISGPLTGQEHPLLMVTGGAPEVSTDPPADIWILDVDRGVWSKVSLPTPIRRRHNHSAVTFGNGSTFTIVVLFGGYDDDSWLSETTILTLELKGDSWQMTKVVKPDEQGSPDEELKELMKKLDISPQNVEFDLSDLNIKKDRRLGKGGFGEVYEGNWKKGGGMAVAVKVTPLGESATLTQEIKVWRSLPQHRNIITFIGVAADDFNMFIVAELAVNGSLFNYLHLDKCMPPDSQSLAWASDIAHGMKHLHDHDVIHRDLKSANVLLTDEWVAKLCDFGTARELSHTTTTEHAGTYRWMSPEIMRKATARINKKCDLFSYGMILFELFAHEIPYADLEDDIDVLLSVTSGKRPPIPPALPEHLHDLLRSCWEEDPHKRPTFDDFVNKFVPTKTE